MLLKTIYLQPVFTSTVRIHMERVDSERVRMERPGYGQRRRHCHVPTANAYGASCTVQVEQCFTGGRRVHYRTSVGETSRTNAYSSASISIGCDLLLIHL